MSNYLLNIQRKEMGMPAREEDYSIEDLVAFREAANITPWYKKTVQTVVEEITGPFKGQFKYTKPKRDVIELIWHCAATPEGKDFTVKDIDGWHRKRGWSGIGYHIIVYRDGSIHAGRNINKIGAHVRNRNTGTIGVCYIGGVSADGRTAKDTRTPAQKAAMLWLTQEIAKDPRIKKISGHNEYASKACPSFDVRDDELGNIPGFKRGIRQ